MLTLDANGRPTYTKGAPKGGRMIRENSIPGQLPRISSSSSNYPPMKPGQIRKSSSASSGNDLNIEIVKLRTHITSLEKENSKLKSQVAQSEKSISNYRSFLSKMTPNDDKYDIGCQTDSYKDDFDHKNNETNKELSKQINLVNKLTEKEKLLNSDMNKLKEEKEKLHKSLNDKQIEIDKLIRKLSITVEESNQYKKDDDKNKNNEKKIDELNLQICNQDDMIQQQNTILAQLQKEIDNTNDQLKNVNNCRGNMDIISKLSNVINNLKSNFSTNMTEIKSSLLDFNNYLKDCSKNVTNVVISNNDSIKHMNNQLNQQLADHKNESSQLLLAKEQLQQDLISKVQELMELNDLKYELKSKNELLNEMTISRDALLSIITSVKDQLPSFNTAYDTEIQSYKKIAHVKDLSRVNELRELTLEKDKLHDEVKHLKEIHNILSFSLTTAEQSLNETQPHVVQKLQEGRGKRLKVLERARNERKKDLDQRSTQTITLTSEHLEGFTVKAEKRRVDAENARKLINERLNDFIKSADNDVNK